MHTSLARLSRAALCAAAVSVVSLAHAQVILTNSVPWNGVDYVAPVGEPDSATIGQTFIPGAAHTVLENFSFHLRFEEGGDVGFRGYVSQWDGEKLTGPLLFESALQMLSPGANTFRPFVFDTGLLSLTPGVQYVAFMSASNEFDSIAGYAGLAAPVQQDSYAGGNLVLALNADNFAALSSDPWIEIFGLDLAFTMSFEGAAVPEPAAFGTIAAIALLVLAGARRMRLASRSLRR
jgi:hypothetical protein